MSRGSIGVPPSDSRPEVPGACPFCDAPMRPRIHDGQITGFRHGGSACREFIRLGLIPTIREAADR